MVHDKPHCSDNTYAGRRADLEDMPTKDKIKRVALWAAWQERGTTAYTVSQLIGCSKEWCRKLLLELESEGLMEVREFTQLKLYILTDEGIAKLKEEKKNVQQRN